MSGAILFEKELICDNCGNAGAFDFMGDYFCPGCLKTCACCQSLFVIDRSKPKEEQKYCSNCNHEQ